MSTLIFRTLTNGCDTVSKDSEQAYARWLEDDFDGALVHLVQIKEDLATLARQVNDAINHVQPNVSAYIK